LSVTEKERLVKRKAKENALRKELFNVVAIN